jgi:UDP-3-O-[3-hydroxymyristoyl] glucosamine N-acyltransferase
MKLNELATVIGGHLVLNHTDEAAKSIAAGELNITNALPLNDASEGCITLVDHPKHAAKLFKSAAAAVMVKSELPGCQLPMLIVEDLHAAFQQAIGLLRPRRIAKQPAAWHPSALVAANSQVGAETTLAAGVVIGENCVVGQRCVLHAGVQLMDNCVLGDDCELFPHVTLYPETRIGQRVLIHAGAVLGAYGFGYRQQHGRHIRAAQLGWVEVGDDVEIGAVTTIDRGAYGATRIGEGTKLDNHVQIAHNCRIGKHNLICAQVGIAGSTVTGDYVVMAGQVGLADHIELGDHVTVGAQSGVMNNVPQGAVVFGSPAVPRRQKLQELASLSRVPAMRQELKELRAAVALLSQQLPHQVPPANLSEDTAMRPAA